MSNNEIYILLIYEITRTILKIFALWSDALQLGITLKNDVLGFFLVYLCSLAYLYDKSFLSLEHQFCRECIPSLCQSCSLHLSQYWLFG